MMTTATSRPRRADFAVLPLPLGGVAVLDVRGGDGALRPRLVRTRDRAAAADDTAR